ncbi:uncharacterized protein LOC135339464 [Halichondria panicea]|uniref:uncharacterized protein LOC135339464 n=1 Tax=Halichondria panicea TaxID=6063 RepID=UPI00312B2B34
MTSENAEVYPGNAAYPNPTFPPNQPPPQPYPGYPPAAPGMNAYDPTKQPMGPGVPAGANPPPYQPSAYLILNSNNQCLLHLNQWPSNRAAVMWW